MTTPTIPLANGGRLPAVGLGLWKVPKPAAPDLVLQAIRTGYRHLDCACDYGNEAEVGAGIRAALDAGLCRREELWVTSKLWNTYHAREHVRAAVVRTLNDLRLDYLDLYLIHFPIAQRFVPFETRYPPGWFFDPDAANPRMEFARVPLAETWAAMEELVDAGLVRNVGVCNYGTAMLRDLLNTVGTAREGETSAEPRAEGPAGASPSRRLRIRPAVLQVELHPHLTQEKLVRFCREEGIAVTAFSPLGALSYFSLGMADAGESVLEQPVIRDTAQRHGKTPAQVVLRWGVQRGTAVVPKTQHPERLTENLAIFDFELSPEEMAAIGGLNRNRRFNDPGVFAEAAFNTFCPIYE